ncbi:aspartate-semialdehyde dehydrogenase [Sesbania bispinosa]|nr:aspartate-semialdehyde dehydrogenase [Sesbania bispinosa]
MEPIQSTKLTEGTNGAGTIKKPSTIDAVGVIVGIDVQRYEEDESIADGGGLKLVTEKEKKVVKLTKRGYSIAEI